MHTFPMSQKEANQIRIFEKLDTRILSQAEAAEILHLSTRQIKRKLKLYRKEGASSLVHGARGKPGNRSFPALFREEVLGIVADKYPDFAPTFAAEKLDETHSLRVNRETLRDWMSEAGLWNVRSIKQKEVRSWREPKHHRGELAQTDGSFHDWFEGRRPTCCLIAFIDDATSEPLWLEFAENESTESLLRGVGHYLEKEGRPLALYTDRGGVYKVNIHNDENDKKTQFERALTELDIELIHARSPQAKGRVERLFRTLQDRLVKELRLRGISSIEEANRYLREEYLAKHTAKFAVSPKSPVDLHRSLEGYNLPTILCMKEERVLQNDWCIKYQGRWLQLDTKQPRILSKKERIKVHTHLDGSTHLWLRGSELSFKELLERPVKVTKSVKSGYVSKSLIPHRPAANHPWRTYTNLHIKGDISKLRERDISKLV